MEIIIITKLILVKINVNALNLKFIKSMWTEVNQILMGKMQKQPLKHDGSCNYTLKLSNSKIEPSTLSKC